MEIWVYNQFADQREIVKVLNDERITIGRDETNDVTLRSPFVSRNHALIVKDSGSYFVQSLGLNGTVVANKTVAPGERMKFEYGDEIRIGEFSVFMMEPANRRITASSTSPAFTAPNRSTEIPARRANSPSPSPSPRCALPRISVKLSSNGIPAITPPV